MKVFVIYDAYAIEMRGVIRADSTESALEIAEQKFGSPLKHDFEAIEFELIEEV